MNDDILQSLLQNFSAKQDSDLGEGDYRDFMTQYMHALNNGANQDDLSTLGANVSPKRRQAMLAYGDSPSHNGMASAPAANDADAAVRTLLRSLGK